MRLNGETLEEVDCIKYWGSQVAADGGCNRDVVHRINEVFTQSMRGAWEVLKSVLSSKGFGKNRKCLYEGVIVPKRCMEKRHGV